VTSPNNGTDYYWQAIPGAAFSCDPGTEGSLQSCSASVDGAPLYNQVSGGGEIKAAGVPLPDAIGTHVVTITATDSDGQTSSETVTYTSSLTALPFVSVSAPVADARYALGQVVKASYSCLPVKNGPPVTGCVASVASGKAINTKSLGEREFTATATDATGQSTTVTVPYFVVPTTNHFTLTQVAANHGGVIRLSLKLPGPGEVNAVATEVPGGAHAAANKPSVYARLRIAAKRAGAQTFTMKPDGRARAHISNAGSTRLVSVAITYTPTGGKPHELRSKVVRIR
jgi:hypothetical protein